MEDRYYFKTNNLKIQQIYIYGAELLCSLSCKSKVIKNPILVASVWKKIIVSNCDKL